MRRLVLLAITTVAVLAGACGGDPTPAPAPSGTPGKSIRDVALGATGTPIPEATVTAEPTLAATDTPTANGTAEPAGTSTPVTPTPQPQTEGGPELPDFAVSVYQGADVVGADAVTLYQLLQQGRPVVVNFWGSSCSGCLEEMPAFEKLNAEYGDRVLLVWITT